MSWKLFKMEMSVSMERDYGVMNDQSNVPFFIYFECVSWSFQLVQNFVRLSLIHI